MPIIDRATQILQKGPVNFSEPDYFGTSPSLINALKNSTLSNLEEQLLLGYNYISYSWQDDHDLYGVIDRKQKEYRTKNQIDDYYYILQSYPEGIIADEDMAYISGRTLFIPGDNGDKTSTADDNEIRTVDNESYLLLKNNNLGDYEYSINESNKRLTLETDRDDFNQFIMQASLWYRPKNAASDGSNDKLIAILTVTPESTVDGKTVQIHNIDNCWSDDINDYPDRAEAKLKWQIV